MALMMGGKGANVNPAGPPPTAAAPSAPRPAAKRRLVTGTVLVEFLPEGGDVGPVNLVYMY